MTANRRRKRRVRARMVKTGESYTAALRHLRRVEEAPMTHTTDYELRHGGVTDTGNVRASNQDQMLTAGDLVAVADGMGGHRAGEVASRLAVDTLQAAFDDDPTADGLVAAVRAANRAVWERSEAEPELRGMGTTIAAVALVADGGAKSLAIVNVGDSRAYLLEEGGLRRLTSDHSLVAEMVEAGAISEDDARVHPQRNVLTRALGVAEEIEPHVGQTAPVRGDRLLLCSDGLFNELDEAQIAAVLAEVADPTDAATRLVDEAKLHGGNDNITALVLDIA